MLEIGSATLVVIGSLALLRIALQATGLGSQGVGRRAMRVVESCALGPRRLEGALHLALRLAEPTEPDERPGRLETEGRPRPVVPQVGGALGLATRQLDRVVPDPPGRHGIFGAVRPLGRQAVRRPA